MRTYFLIAAFGVSGLGLSACSNPEQRFMADCEAGGITAELCTCLYKRLPPERREALFDVPEKVDGEWVLPHDMAPALSCFDVGTSSAAG
jgi:hypothetical protein